MRSFTSNYIWLGLIFLLLFSCGSSSEKTSSAPPTEDGWTGTISLKHIQTTYHAAPYSEFIYQKRRHLFDQLMEGQFTNSKGHTKTMITLVDTSYYDEKIGSRRVEQWEIDNGKAKGDSSTELMLSLDPQTNTYSIEVPIPVATGTKTRTHLCNGCGQAPDPPVTSEMGEDETSIMIDNEKMGPDSDILSGEKIDRKKIDNGEGDEITTTRWKFTRVKN